VRIPYADYKEHIPDRAGTQVAINHLNCPAGVDSKRRLYIKRTDDAVLVYCHHCSGHAVRSTRKGVRSVETIKRLLADAEEHERVVSTVELPFDVNYRIEAWPVEAQAWLYKYAINSSDVADYSICYSETWNRVIIPVYDAGRLVFWQGRKVADTGPGPKYISVRSSKKPMFATYSRNVLPKSTGRKLVVVEDCLSAIRIARDTCADAIALLGTTAPSDLVAFAKRYPHVIVWLDDDDAGRTKAIDIHRSLVLMTSSNVTLRTMKQPKELEPSVLKASIDGE
jgi:DNA primase